jgi:hypothetical protein
MSLARPLSAHPTTPPRHRSSSRLGEQGRSRPTTAWRPQIASRPYTAYPFQRIAGFSGDQKDAMGCCATWPLTSFKGAGKFEVPRMIDDIGKGGSVEKYMNPYVDNVSRPHQRPHPRGDRHGARSSQSNNTAHAAGAFGDARHGIADALIEDKGIQQMGDAAARAMRRPTTTPRACATPTSTACTRPRMSTAADGRVDAVHRLPLPLRLQPAEHGPERHGPGLRRTSCAN